jgi:hypothetical protein
MRTSSFAAALIVLAVATTAGCATTYDASRAPSTAPSTTTTVPTGPVADLLSRLADKSLGLSAVMIAGGNTTAAAEQIAALWAAARPDVQSKRPDLVDSFDATVAKFALAVQFKRAADADKAAKNIEALVAAFAG